MKNKFAIALVASVAAIAALATDASAGGHGGGGGGGGHGGGGGGGGFHGGGGGAFHGGGGGPHGRRGGGGFHAMGGGGMRMGGGGFHPGGGFHAGGSGFHANAFRGGNLGAFRAGSVRGFTGTELRGAPFAGHAMSHRTLGGTIPGRSFGGPRTLAHQNAPFGGANRNLVGRAGAVGAGAALGAAAGTHAQFAHLTHAQFAHNQFAAQNFHGLHNFSHTGFNRNAFGDPGDWNRWGGHFWGAGWTNWGWGWGGWAGPVFWPFLFGDVFSFAVWPYDYYDPFWAYGPDFLLVSIFAPGPYFGPDYGYAPDYTGYLHSPDVYYGGGGYAGYTVAAVMQADMQPLLDLPRSYRSRSPASLKKPMRRRLRAATRSRPASPICRLRTSKTRCGRPAISIPRSMSWSAAVAKANELIKASCPTAVPLTPVARLDAAEARLQAMIQALDIVRDPLQRFYVLLTDEQRERFNAMGNERRRAGAGRRQRGGALQRAVERCDQIAGAAHRRGAAAERTATRRLRSSRRRRRKIAPPSCAGPARARCRKLPTRASMRSNAARRHGGGHERHPPEAARLLCLAE